MHVNQRSTIDAFLSAKRMAVVGVSREAHDFTRAVFKTLREKGYDAVPVNPAATEIDGQPCYGKVSAIQPGVDSALLMVPAQHSAGIVTDCLAAGVRHVWLYRAIGQGSVSDQAVELCDRAGVPVVAGECIFMFLPDCGWIHPAHACLRKITGTFPR
jgi:predicted CoA-binding protein